MHKTCYKPSYIKEVLFENDINEGHKIKYFDNNKIF